MSEKSHSSSMMRDPHKTGIVRAVARRDCEGDTEMRPLVCEDTPRQR